MLQATTGLSPSELATGPGLEPGGRRCSQDGEAALEKSEYHQSGISHILFTFSHPKPPSLGIGAKSIRQRG